ncbi:3-oxoacyl-[acyl-carrier-protein] synthase, KASIII [Minicystis rosea]|nr:3-oxoacyl-[acyl-carrier-protein] synthase, KASIII [Minicystis rosea]
MIIRDIGILGMGLWEGEVITNDHYGDRYLARAQVKDPYRGMRGDDGTVRIAGMVLSPDRYPRAIAAIEQSFRDPYRGTLRRRLFPHDLKVSDAETEAARKAIADAGLTPADIDAVLVQSFLPDQFQPKNSAIIAHNLGIRHAPAWEIDSICNSALIHLTVGSSLIVSGFGRHILCVQSTAYSRVSDPASSTNIQDADLASAFVLGPSPGTEMAVSWRTDGRLHGAIRLAWGTPGGEPPARWWERSPERLQIRFDPALQEEVMSEIAGNAKTVCDEALQRAGMRSDDLETFIAHQPMSWNKAFMEDVLSLEDGVAYDTFEEYACINSVGIPASIYEARRSGRIKRGSNVLLFGPAAGYTYAAAAIRW